MGLLPHILVGFNGPTGGGWAGSRVGVCSLQEGQIAELSLNVLHSLPINDISLTK